jgi:molybdate transport system ATP-binding protein
VSDPRHDVDPQGGLSFEARLGLGELQLDARFQVSPGETLALMGPSGAGKTTCLSVIAGLLRPDEGRVELNGETLLDTANGVDLPPERRRLGLLFQDYALFPHLTVLGNVLFGARLRLRDRDKAASLAREWLERLELDALAGRHIRDLSGGERQRVALARALASQPRALLLDEPLAALDLSTRAFVRSQLQSFLAEVGLPTVLVTHDPVDALAFGRRLAVIEEGRVSQSGSREDLLMHPRSPFVAEVAGVNLYRARVAAGRGLKSAQVEGALFHVLADAITGLAFLAFAPAEVALFAERPAGSAQNVFAGSVREIQALPDRLRVLVEAGVPMAADVTREAATGLSLEPGRQVWAAVKAAAIRVYT